MRSFPSFLVLALAGLGLFTYVCSINSQLRVYQENPVESGTWVPCKTEPDWVTVTPVKKGSRYFVETGRSNLRDLAAGPRGPLASVFFEQNLTNALRPIIGVDAAARTAQDVLAKLVLVDRACREENYSRSNSIPSELWTAWALWELPLDAAMSSVPTEHRVAARELLSTIDLTSRPE